MSPPPPKLSEVRQAARTLQVLLTRRPLVPAAAAAAHRSDSDLPTQPQPSLPRDVSAYSRSRDPP